MTLSVGDMTLMVDCCTRALGLAELADTRHLSIQEHTAVVLGRRGTDCD